MVSDRAKEQQNTQRKSRMKVERKSMKNQSKIVKTSTKIDDKTMKFRSWAVLGAQGRFGDAPGRTQDGSETPKDLPGADLGPPWACQERPGVVQKRPQGDPETLLELLRPLPSRS